MTETISILHISDLHRSRGNETSNAALVSSLINDKESYTTKEEKRIKAPDLIIVSGDIIRGSIDLHNSEQEIKEQYDEAIGFLTELSNHFLDGDKKRLVTIPGNHDVDWKYSRESMTKIHTNNVFDEKNNVKSRYLNDSINSHSNIRWSWKDLSFYEITDSEIYNKRLEAFTNFYSNFYDGERSYSIHPAKQYDIFDYPNYNITIVAFNSCYCNDHLRFVGEIHPDCIADSNLKLSDYRKKGRLIMATWHHNTKGLPYEFNYMDSNKLKNFINSGISLGFHGHQHKTEIIHEFSDVIEQKKIMVFSAGTICGGRNELPVGNDRQYNIVEINSDNNVDHLTVTLHTREKTNSSSFENPIWSVGRIDSNLVSHYTVKIDKPKAQEMENVLLEIEGLMKNGNYSAAKEKLVKLDFTDDFVRKFLVECLINAEDNELALEIFSIPETAEEFIVVLTAAIELNNKTKMEEMKNIAKTYTSSNPSINELVNKIEAILR